MGKLAWDLTFTVNVMAADNSTDDMVERELGAILGDAVLSADHINAYEVTHLVDVVAAVRKNKEGKYWLCRRNGDGAHGGLAGMWEYPGGKVEPGEQLREALLRELEEEFGWATASGARSVRVGPVLDSIASGAYRVTFFEVEMEEPVFMRKHSEVAWMTPAEACDEENLPSGTIFNARHLAAPDVQRRLSEFERFTSAVAQDVSTRAVVKDAARRLLAWRSSVALVKYEDPAAPLRARVRELEEQLVEAKVQADWWKEIWHNVTDVNDQYSHRMAEYRAVLSRLGLRFATPDRADLLAKVDKALKIEMPVAWVLSNPGIAFELIRQLRSLVI